MSNEWWVMSNEGAMHNSYSIASFLIVGSWQLAVGRKINHKVRGFIGSKVRHTGKGDFCIEAYSKNLRSLRILRTLSKLSVGITGKGTSPNLWNFTLTKSLLLSILVTAPQNLQKLFKPFSKKRFKISDLWWCYIQKGKKASRKWYFWLIWNLHPR